MYVYNSGLDYAQASTDLQNARWHTPLPLSGHSEHLLVLNITACYLVLVSMSSRRASKFTQGKGLPPFPTFSTGHVHTRLHKNDVIQAILFRSRTLKFQNQNFERTSRRRHPRAKRYCDCGDSRSSFHRKKMTTRRKSRYIRVRCFSLCQV